MIDAATTLGDVITTHPALAAELERLGLDYCCGGARTLAVACIERGLDVRSTVGELRSAAAALDRERPDWTSMGVAELVDHVESTHHRYLWDELPRLSSLTDKIVRVHADRHPELVEVAHRFAELRAELEPHLADEERVVFPLIRQLATSGAALLVHPRSHLEATLLAEHDRIGALLADLRRLTDAYQPPTDGCASFRACYAGLAELEADTHLHVHKENNLLLPSVVRLIERLAGGSVVTGTFDEGGEPACWAHLFEDHRSDITTRGDIHRLVVDFYRDVAMDDLLGPIFAAAHVDWSVHIPRLTDFWAWQLLGEPAYERNPLRAHEPVHARTPFRDDHYQRWLELFETTVNELFAGPVAVAAKRRAQRMAKAMRRMLDGQSAVGDAAVEIPWTKAETRSLGP